MGAACVSSHSLISQTEQMQPFASRLQERPQQERFIYEVPAQERPQEQTPAVQ